MAVFQPNLDLLSLTFSPRFLKAEGHPVAETYERLSGAPHLVEMRPTVTLHLDHQNDWWENPAGGDGPSQSALL